jgi:hypothetical protein
MVVAQVGLGSTTRFYRWFMGIKCTSRHELKAGGTTGILEMPDQGGNAVDV